MVKKLNLLPDEDFVLLGIVSTEKDYTLCSEINRWLRMNFVRDEDLEITVGKHRTPSSYTRYYFENESDGQEIYFIVNRGSADVLIPEYRQLDFFMMIKGNLYEEDKENLIDNLKQLPYIQGVYEIETDSLKSKENLLF